MPPTANELAGVVDLFGALTDAELERAVAELDARGGREPTDAAALEAVVDDARERFVLLECDLDGQPGVTVGPTAFPERPAHAEDLPHILEIEYREIDPEALESQVRERFDAAVERACEEGDGPRARTLLDVSYDLEAWAPLDLSGRRSRLEPVIE
ncbi:DUF7109 family protein [Halovivax limisalsi]|uniref:DUF7109 family protein n=1 Tax=Halovivax limisalsi TaxID=1453760 RepID=UPI001FFCDAA3|nr:hypothetical protein [Halovivax limisalsi]